MMNDPKKKMRQRIALVTGASSGIGQATAILLAKNDFYVFAVARRKHRLDEICSDTIETIPLDVMDEVAIDEVVRHIIETKGRIDVLVNNAGYGQLGTIECVSMEAAHRQFEVNVFGYARCMQAVLPHMREQRSGCIINISSVLGRFSLPGFGWYAASKHAVEALSEALRGEVKALGIDVVMIAPGLIKTEFVTKEFELLKTVEHPSAYQKILTGLHQLVSHEPQCPGPEIIARAVLKAISRSIPPVRYAVPWDSKAAVISRWIFGGRLFAWILRKKIGI